MRLSWTRKGPDYPQWSGVDSGGVVRSVVRLETPGVYDVDGRRMRGTLRDAKTFAERRPQPNGLAKDAAIAAGVLFVGVPLAIYGIVLLAGYSNPGGMP